MHKIKQKKHMITKEHKTQKQEHKQLRHEMTIPKETVNQ
jgi:hypothetical protein